MFRLRRDEHDRPGQDRDGRRHDHGETDDPLEEGEDHAYDDVTLLPGPRRSLPGEAW